MPIYHYACDSCGYRTAQWREMRDCAAPAPCPDRYCVSLLSRRFTLPSIIGQPERLREANKWWWLKDGEPYSRTDRLREVKEETRRWEASQEEFAQNRRQYGLKY